MNIIVFGSNGQLGRCLAEKADASGIKLIQFDRQQGDITDKSAVERIIAQHEPAIIINAAAYTLVDQAECDHMQAFANNVVGPRNLAQVAKKFHCPLIHISTDYVFDGKATKPYQPDAPTNPTTIYGKTKYQGEQAIRKELCEHVILRTSWLFSEYSKNFLTTMLSLARKHQQINVVADQIGCPTYAGDLAAASLEIAQQIVRGAKNWGTFHFCGDDPVSWYQFAQAIFEEQARNKRVPAPQLNPIPTSAYPTRAKRPQYSVLDCSETWRRWNLSASSWKAALRPVIEKLESESAEPIC